VIAARARDWLRPGGWLALAWSDVPFEGTAPWQRAMREVMARWTARLAVPGAAPRVPPDWAASRQARPDAVILRAAGLEPAGRHEFTRSREWTLDGLAGFAMATAVLSRAALGPLVPDFRADLGRCLLAAEPGGVFGQDIGFAYELARRPGFAPDAASSSP
jgi:hypothetical protein